LEFAMAHVGAFEVKTHFASLLERAAKGEEIVITRHGMPVAKLTPMSADNREPRREAIQRLMEFSKGQTLGDLAIRELRDEGRR
jgi:prevent-host-death family protein